MELCDREVSAVAAAGVSVAVAAATAHFVWSDKYSKD